MKHFEVVISGVKRGTLWMPATECEKEFSETFSSNDRPFSRQWAGLRDAVLYILNDGDFQNCSLDFAQIAVTRWNRNKKTTVYHELVPCKLLNDCFA